MTPIFRCTCKLLFLLMSCSVATAQNIDSLRTVLHGDSPLSDKLVASKVLSTKLANLDSVEAAAVVREGLALAAQLGDEESRFFLESQRARILVSQGRYQEANDICEFVLSRISAERYQSVSMNCYEILGQMHLKENQYVKSRDLLKKVMQYYQKQQDEPGVARVSYYLGSVFHRLGDLPQAEEAFGRSLEISEQRKDPLGMALVLKQQAALPVHFPTLPQSKQSQILTPLI